MSLILLCDFLADLASAIRSVYGMMASVHPLLSLLVIGIVVVRVILRFILVLPARGAFSPLWLIGEPLPWQRRHKCCIHIQPASYLVYRCRLFTSTIMTPWRSVTTKAETPSAHGPPCSESYSVVG